MNLEPEAGWIINHIWLAEDDADDAELFEEAVKQIAPHTTVSVFLNGEELLKELKKSKPDLLFLDINLPLINGLDVLKAIRAIYTLEQLPIMVMSGSSRKRDMENAYQSGASRYIEKPSTYQDLVHTIEGVLKNK